MDFGHWISMAQINKKYQTLALQAILVVLACFHGI